MALSRRSLVAATVLLPVAGLALGGTSAHAAPPHPAIRPRADWAEGLAPKGPLELEDDVRFLLVHHTLTPNTDTAERIPERLRSFYRFHTSAERGWADVAYNFFVDPYGTIWEGREGSLDRPVKGDATGGSQGHALLCCFVGDHTTQAPTPAAMAAMTALLAWLAGRHGLTLAEEVTFTSRGSSRWREGAQVTTAQVAAHRDMSATECPGDALYPLVASQLLPDARALLASMPTPSPTPDANSTPTPQPTPSPTPWPATPEVSDDVLRAVGGGALAVGVGGVLAATLGRRGRGPVESAGPEEPTAGSAGAEQGGDDDGAADGEGAEQAQEEPDQRP